MQKRNKILTSINWVYFFSGFGLLTILVIWPLLKDIGFLVAGILLNVLALTYWLKVVRPQVVNDKRNA